VFIRNVPRNEYFCDSLYVNSPAGTVFFITISSLYAQNTVTLMLGVLRSVVHPSGQIFHNELISLCTKHANPNAWYSSERRPSKWADGHSRR